VRSKLIAITALAVGLGLAGAASAQPTVINVQLSDFKFVPMQIDLRVGQPYVLHLVNTSGKSHDFSATAFFAAVALAPASAGKVHEGDVALDGGESADIALTPQRAGTYPLKCTHLFHEMLGMKGQIVVQ
jgi:uncharacterized cupredoxin-like copper-binding protein